MKTKRTAKTIPATSSTAHDPQAATTAALPPEMQCLAVSPAKAIAALFPKAAAKPEAWAALAGFFAGIGIDLGEPVPEWAKQASKRFWDATAMSFAGKTPADLTPEEVGKLVGLWETTPQDEAVQSVASQFLQAMDSFCQSIKKAINDDPPEVARDFHSGRAKAVKVADKASNLQVRSQIFLFIACGWRTVETFKGQAELWRWLTKKDEADKSMVNEFAYADPMRELRTVCKLIGLTFRARRKPD